MGSVKVISSADIGTIYESLTTSQRQLISQLITESSSGLGVKSLIAVGKAFMEAYDPAGSLDDTPVDGLSKPVLGDDKLIEELNAIYTPIMVTQELDDNVGSRVMEACSADNVLVENNIIQFDDDTRKAQLVSLCALLIARQNDSEKYQAYKQASEVRKTMKLDIQRENHAAAVALANKYLAHVAASSQSSVVRKAAQDLSSVSVNVAD